MQVEEEWKSKAAERDGQIEDLQGHLWEAERAREAAEDSLKTVNLVNSAYTCTCTMLQYDRYLHLSYPILSVSEVDPYHIVYPLGK